MQYLERCTKNRIIGRSSAEVRESRHILSAGKEVIHVIRRPGHVGVRWKRRRFCSIALLIVCLDCKP